MEFVLGIALHIPLSKSEIRGHTGKVEEDGVGGQVKEDGVRGMDVITRMAESQIREDQWMMMMKVTVMINQGITDGHLEEDNPEKEVTIMMKTKIIMIDRIEKDLEMTMVNMVMIDQTDVCLEEGKKCN